MKEIKVKVSMENGTGFGVFIKIGKIILFFAKSETQSIRLVPNNYIATIGGHEPTSSTVKIDFVDDGNILASHKFSTPTFFGLIHFKLS